MNGNYWKLRNNKSLRNRVCELMKSNSQSNKEKNVKLISEVLITENNTENKTNNVKLCNKTKKWNDIYKDFHFNSNTTTKEANNKQTNSNFNTTKNNKKINYLKDDNNNTSYYLNKYGNNYTYNKFNHNIERYDNDIHFNILSNCISNSSVVNTLVQNINSQYVYNNSNIFFNDNSYSKIQFSQSSINNSNYNYISPYLYQANKRSLNPQNLKPQQTINYFRKKL